VGEIPPQLREREGKKEGLVPRRRSKAWKREEYSSPCAKKGERGEGNLIKVKKEKRSTEVEEHVLTSYKEESHSFFRAKENSGGKTVRGGGKKDNLPSMIVIYK